MDRQGMISGYTTHSDQSIELVIDYEMP